MRIPGAGRGVANHAGSSRTILHRTTISLVSVEDLCNAALGRVRHPVLSVPDFVELDMLELSVGCHCCLKHERVLSHESAVTETDAVRAGSETSVRDEIGRAHV